MPVKRKTVPVKRPAADISVVLDDAPSRSVIKTTTTKKPPAKKKVTEPAATRPKRHRVSHVRSAVDRLDDPPPAPLPALLKRVSSAIERELTQIEIIVCGSNAARGRWLRSRARCAR
jgi:hypothetical protein